MGLLRAFPALLSLLSALAAARGANSPPLLRIPLENFDQMQFFGEVHVGAPRSQRFLVIFDTGSSDLWLPGVDCGVCAGERRYNPRLSATFEPLDEPFHLEYGSGNATGAVMKERLLLGDGETQDRLQLDEVRMGSVSATTKRLQRFQADGIVGLGLDALALITKPSLFKSDTQGRDHLLARFSMYINPLPGAQPGAQLIFGGVDEALPLASVSSAVPANGSAIEWHHFPVVPYPSGSKVLGFWAIRMTKLTVGQSSRAYRAATPSSGRLRQTMPSVPAPLENEELDEAGDAASLEDEVVDIVDVHGGSRDAIAIVDSGTSLLLLPRDMFDHVLRVITRHLESRHNVQLIAHGRAVSGVGCWYCSPEQFPPLTFAFATTTGPSQRLTLQGSDYVRCDDYVCAPQLDVHSLFSLASGEEHTEDVIILGVMFMRAYYTMFDVEQRSVAFACVNPVDGECRGGQHLPLQFHSDFLGDRVRWHYGWLFWSRLYLSIMLMLLSIAALLFWMALSMSLADVEKALLKLWASATIGITSGGSTSEGETVQVFPLFPTEPEPEELLAGIHEPADDAQRSGIPARRKSVSFDV